MVLLDLDRIRLLVILMSYEINLYGNDILAYLPQVPIVYPLRHLLQKVAAVVKVIEMFFQVVVQVVALAIGVFDLRIFLKVVLVLLVVVFDYHVSMKVLSEVEDCAQLYLMVALVVVLFDRIVVVVALVGEAL